MMFHTFGPDVLNPKERSLDACLPASASPMAHRPGSGPERSTEAPMDFQFTSRPNVGVVPVWKTPATPLKREHASSHSNVRNRLKPPPSPVGCTQVHILTSTHPSRRLRSPLLE